MRPSREKLKGSDVRKALISYQELPQPCIVQATKRKEKPVIESKALNKFNEKIITKALETLDQDKMAKKLAKHLEKQIPEDMKNYLEHQFDFGEFVLENLHDNSTKMGGNFHAAMEQITQRMVEAVLVKEK